MRTVLPKKLGIFHHAGIGDWILFSPSVRVIKQASPQTKVFVLGNGSIKWLLESDKNIDGFSILPDCSALKNNFKYTDKIFVSSFFGFFTLTQCRMHILNLTFKILGIPVSERNMLPELCLSKKDEAFGRHYAGIFKNRMITVCNNASSRAKSWDTARWNQVIKKFKDYLFVQIGDKHSQPIPGAVNMAGRTTLPQAMGLLKYSRLFVGIDGIFNHVARIFNIPKIVLWSLHNPMNFAYRDNTVNIWKGFQCSSCSSLRRSHCGSRKELILNPCMEAITTGEVVNAINKMLGRGYDRGIAYYTVKAPAREYCRRCAQKEICTIDFFAKRLSDLFLWKIPVVL